MDDLVQELKSKIIEGLEIDDASPEDFGPDSPLFGEGLGLDSIDALEIIVLLEREYGIKVADKKTAEEALATFGTLAEFVTRHRAGPAASKADAAQQGDAG